MRKNLGKYFKKSFAMAMILMLLVMSMPVISVADRGGDHPSFSVEATNVTKTSANLEFKNQTPNSILEVSWAPHDGQYNNGQFSNLKKSTMYTVNVTESKIYNVNKSSNNYYYYNERNTKVYVDKDDTYKIGNTRYIKIKLNTAQVKFTTLSDHVVTLSVGTGGIAIYNGQTYTPGNHSILAEAGASLGIVSYANAGYSGGHSINYNVNGANPETVLVEFTSRNAIHELPFYQIDGFFSGLNLNGDKISDNNPKGDILNGSFEPETDKASYILADTAIVTLTVNVTDGDHETNNLVEVDFYDGIGPAKTFGSVTTGSEIEYSYTIPATVTELLTSGYAKQADDGNFEVYAKTISYELVDRYNNNGGAALLHTDNAVLTVKVEKAPVVVAQGTVNIYHEFPNADLNHQTLDPLSGDVGSDYTALPDSEYTDAYNYTLKEGSAPATGKFSTEVITVTYVYNLKPVEPTTGTVFINHEFPNGDKFNDQTKVEGTIGENYTAEPISNTAYSVALKVDSSPATGQYTNEPITVTYVYTLKQTETQVPPSTNPPVQPTTQAPTEPQGPQGSVVVNFVDTEGNSLGSSFSFTGTVGTLYQTSARTITGYDLVETPANASGSFIDGSLTVDYVYSSGTVVIEEEANALSGAKAIVNFDSIFDNMEVTTEATDEVILVDENTPLADALPQTGQASPELFYGIGGIVSALGIFLKRKNK